MPVLHNSSLNIFITIHFRLNLKNVEEDLLSQYADIAISDGQITLADFSKYLGIPESEPSLVELFKLYDKVRLMPGVTRLSCLVTL